MDTAHLNTLRKNIYKCLGCGICRGVWDRKDEALCPVWATGVGFEDSVPRGRVTVAQDILDGFLHYSLPLAQSVYRCTDCQTCAVLCDAMDPESGEPIIDVPEIVKAMKRDLVENSLVPPLVRDYFKAIHTGGNPYKESQSDRGKWSKNLNIPVYSGQDYLFYVGDIGSFDERGKKMTQSVAKLLTRWGLSIGILSSEEFSDGNEVQALGETGLFRYLAELNINKFNEVGAKKIITVDPHSFNAFKNEYPKHGANFEVWHYTQILSELIRKRNVSFSEYEIRITYHDPCYLGRHNDIYEPPRQILKGIPGVELVEMKRNRKNAFCCGGGGGNFFTDLLGGGLNSPSRLRIREARETGSKIVAVACPICCKMLDTALRDEGFENELVVKDISEIVLEAIKDK